MSWRIGYLLSLVAAGGTVSAGCDGSSLLDVPRGGEVASETSVVEGQSETPASYDQGNDGSLTLGCVLAPGGSCQASTQPMEDFGSADEPVCVGDGRTLIYFTGSLTNRDGPLASWRHAPPRG